MTVIALSLVVFLLAAAGLSLGLMFGRSGIRGSCRAMADAAPGGGDCACAEPCPRRRRELARAAGLGKEAQS
jgi:hypothetical protein